MADPLTGILSSEDEATVTDYLGRTGPVASKGSATLPVGGAPVAGGGGPVAPGGTGVSPIASSVGGGARKAAGGDELGSRLAGLGQRTLEQLRKAGAFDSSPSGARNPETEQAFQAQRAGERADLTGAAGAGGAVPSTLASGASPTTITGEFSPEIQALFGGAGAGGAAVPSTLASGAPLTSITGELSPEIAGLLTSGGGAGTTAAGTAAGTASGEAAGTAAATAGLDAALGVAGLWAGPILSFLYSNYIEPSHTPYRFQREKAYSKLGQQVEGGFMPAMQEAVTKGPEAVQKLLTPENLKEYGLEVQQDPSGQYTVGLSSVGHPYIKYTDALNAQTQLSEAVNQALQLSRAFQLMQPSPNGTAPEPPPPKPPTTPAGGGPLGLAEIGLEVGR